MGLIDGIDVSIKPIVDRLATGTHQGARQQNTPNDQQPIVGKWHA
jgi:hypothetical protein